MKNLCRYKTSGSVLLSFFISDNLWRNEAGPTILTCKTTVRFLTVFVLDHITGLGTEMDRPQRSIKRNLLLQTYRTYSTLLYQSENKFVSRSYEKIFGLPGCAAVAKHKENPVVFYQESLALNNLTTHKSTINKKICDWSRKLRTSLLRYRKVQEKLL